MDCLFCKISQGEIPSNRVYEDERVYAFRDIDPQAPTHILIVPKKHLDSVAKMGPQDEELLGYMIGVAKDIAAKEGLDNGYRLVINTGEDGGQTVSHLHIHLLGGRSLQWPPG